MKKRLMAALLAILALIPTTTRAEVTETVAQSIFTEVTPKQPKARKVTDSFWYLGVQGGIVVPNQYDEVALQISGILGYKHRIGTSNFMLGGQITVGSDINGWNHSGIFGDFAPTISYMRFPGGFYNSFEATLGLGFGYRQDPSGGFAFTPELNLTYWFNWFGIGVTVRESFQKSYLEDHSHYYYDYTTMKGQTIWQSDKHSGNRFFAMLRLAARF